MKYYISKKKKNVPMVVLIKRKWSKLHYKYRNHKPLLFQNIILTSHSKTKNYALN